MNANDNVIQNKEAYNGVVGALLHNGMPKEIAEYDKKAKEITQERERLKKQQEVFGGISNIAGNFESMIEGLEKQLPASRVVIMPIKIIVKRTANTFSILDYTIEYRLNGAKGIVVKIISNSVENAVFNIGIGISISLAIATAIAGYFLSIPLIATGIIAFLIFSVGVAITSLVSTWTSNISKEILDFIYEYVYLPAESSIRNLQNGFDYLINGKWYDEFIRLFMFNNAQANKMLEYELRNKYGDDEVDDMDEFERNYRMRFNR